MRLGPHLELLGLSILTSLYVTKPGDELGHFFPLKGRMIIALQVVFCPNGTDKGFAFFDPSQLCLDVARSARSIVGGMDTGRRDHLLFRLEAAVFIHSLHMGFPNASQLVLEILKVTRFRSSLLLSVSNVPVEVIQSLHDFLVSTCDNERSAGDGKP